MAVSPEPHGITGRGHPGRKATPDEKETVN